jgi:hypothetical protein
VELEREDACGGRMGKYILRRSRRGDASGDGEVKGYEILDSDTETVFPRGLRDVIEGTAMD